MAIKTLEEKFMHGLGDIYDAEHRFLEAQQQMLPSANSEAVKMMLEQHITETEQQITNLEQVFQLFGKQAERVSCKGAAGIVSENQELLKETSAVPTLADLAIAGGQGKVEHYEVAAYRALVLAAQTMGEPEALQLLQLNLQQEEATAQKVEANMPTLLEQAMISDDGTTAAANA